MEFYVNTEYYVCVLVSCRLAVGVELLIRTCAEYTDETL